jgi:hypothetical protein
MKNYIPVAALVAALALAGCGESVPPTETVTADEGVGGGADLSSADNAAITDADIGSNNSALAGTADADAGMNDSVLAGSAGAANASANATMAADGNKMAMSDPKKPTTIAKTTSYRCDDKSIIKIDYMSDETSAMIRAEGKPPLLLKADKIGGAMAADDGSRLSSSGKEVVYKMAEGKSVTCKA